MIPGFNHNVRYKGVLYHVQTEDSGSDNPVVTTLLYQAGTILHSKRTSYADIVSSEKMDDVVREIMKEQHKMMLMDLKNGVFDNAGAKPAAEAVPNIPPEVPAQAEVDLGDGGISEKTLDEVILDYLANEDTD
ncbi:MAG: hypothetical protein JW885_06260 [Deltaproteobacteria bacterium]|nr:hypothetical protein [Candidatus Zymogenaceae bacterium]